MAIPKFLEDLNIVSRIGDKPGTDSGLSTPQFKAKFDECGLKIQNYINNVLIPGIENAVSEDGLLAQIYTQLNSKLDNFGGRVTGNIDMSGNMVGNLRDPSTDTDASNRRYVDNSIKNQAEGKKLAFTNVLVPASAFVANSTYEDYPFRAAVALNGVAATGYIPEVIFDLTDATSGIFSPVAVSYNGGVYIYAAEDPAKDTTIPTIICWREG